jgi:hypothetical protein
MQIVSRSHYQVNPEAYAFHLWPARIKDFHIQNLSVNKLLAGTIAVQFLLATGGSLATAASGARVEITPTGIKLYDSDGTQRGLISNDGSGWFGGSTDFSWTAAGAVSINGAKIQDLTVDTAQIANLSVTGGKVAADVISTYPYIPSEVLQNSNDAERTTTSESAVKLKETKLNSALGACRIKFDLKGKAEGGVYAKIYKNGTPIGSLRTVDSVSYTTFSEDFTSFVADDLIQVYAYIKAETAETAYVRNLRFYYSRQITHIEAQELSTALTLETSAISMTNQDP